MYKIISSCGHPKTPWPTSKGMHGRGEGLLLRGGREERGGGREGKAIPQGE